MRNSCLILVLVTSLPAVFAQSEDSETEDVVELSPFLVDASPSEAYHAASSLAGARLATPLIDPATATIPPPVAVSITKRAEEVAIQFVLSHSGDKQEVRNRELYASLESIEAAVKNAPGLRMEQREVRFTGGNRRLFSTAHGGAPVSFASLVIFADLSPEACIVDRVKQVRDLIQSTKLAGQTKTADGSVGLYVKHLDHYRREILQKIFADLEFLKQGLGPDFEVRPSGLNQRVRARIASETEIELWIDYSFTIQSVRELAGAKKAGTENSRL